MSWMEVEVLIGRAQGGDRQAFDELVRRFEGSVFAGALTKMRNPQAAQELTHEVFVHAWRKLGQLRNPRSFSGWLRQITARMAINRLSKAVREFGAESEVLDSIEGAHVGPLDQMERNESRREVQDALRRLKPLDREALEAHYLRGQALEAIAEELEVPLGTVKRRLHVARKRLKALLEGELVGA